KQSRQVRDDRTENLDPSGAELMTNVNTINIRRVSLSRFMGTHNMQRAVDMGDRLIMMDKGEIVLDVSGEEKSTLTVEGPLREFKRIRGEQLVTDQTILG